MHGLTIAPLTYYYYGDYKIDESSFFPANYVLLSVLYNPPWSRTHLDALGRPT